MVRRVRTMVRRVRTMVRCVRTNRFAPDVHPNWFEPWKTSDCCALTLTFT